MTAQNTHNAARPSPDLSTTGTAICCIAPDTAKAKAAQSSAGAAGRPIASPPTIIEPRSWAARSTVNSDRTVPSRLALCANLAIPAVAVCALAAATTLAADTPSLTLEATQVGRFEKIEMQIGLGKEYGNPFDPAEVRCDIELTGPQGQSVLIPAFYTQPYRYEAVPRSGKKAAWFYPEGKPQWRARFAAPVEGRWTARAVVADARGTARSESSVFNVGASVRRGFLQTAKADSHYLQFSTGEPFFAIGQNLAFIGPGQYVDLPRAEQIFGRLRANGANFARVWICCHDWALAIEAEKSAWGRSWSGAANLVAHPDRAAPTDTKRCARLAGKAGHAIAVDPSHPVALQPETAYVLSARAKSDNGAKVRLELGGRSAAIEADRSWKSVALKFVTGPNDRWIERIRLVLESEGEALIDSVSLREDRPDSVELLWEADPNRPMPGTYNLLDAAMLDQLLAAAERDGVYLQLCVVTRDLYMKHLKDPQSAAYERSIEQVKNLMRYCLARWGYSTHVAAWEYFNEIDPGLPTDVFYQQVGEFVAGVDPFARPRTTSTWHPSARDCRHPQIDLPQVHHYLRPTLGESGHDESAAVIHWARFLREHGPRKPGLIAEFGLADDKWGLSPLMKEDERLDHFHNSLWASALSGTAGTAMFWWWERLDQQDGYRHYKPLAAFLAGEPLGIEPVSPIQPDAGATRFRVLGLRGTHRVLLWLFDTDTNWHRTLVEKKPPERASNVQIRLTGLTAGQWKLQWWDTRAGKPFAERTISVSERETVLTAPVFERDLGAKLIYSPETK